MVVNYELFMMSEGIAYYAEEAKFYWGKIRCLVGIAYYRQSTEYHTDVTVLVEFLYASVDSYLQLEFIYYIGLTFYLGKKFYLLSTHLTVNNFPFDARTISP